jgi:hypothetical protein
VFLTTKRLGQIVQAVGFMFKMTMSFLAIFFCWLICCSAVFTSIWYDDKGTLNYYSDFIMSLTSLFAASLTVYNTQQFEENKWLGIILLSFFVIISNIVLINLLIALLSEAFNNVTKEADSRHRAILIGYRNRWKWSDEYGFLIFVPPPISIISFFFLPLIFFPKPLRKQLNILICYVFFIFCYGIPMCILSLLYNLMLCPIAYFKGFMGLRNLIFKKSTFLNLLIWLLFGYTLLVYLTV